MPKALNNMQFPVSYGPWYVYEAEIDSSVTAFDKFDVLVPHGTNTSKFARATDDDVIVTGAVIALEKFETGMTSVQVATMGSLVPSVAGGAILPGSLVTIELDGTDGMKVLAAVAADIAAGKVLGRMRNHADDSKNLRAAVDDDIVFIQTGVF